MTVNGRVAEPDQLAGLAHLLQVGPDAFNLLAGTRDFEADGPWVRVNLEVHPENPPRQHVPPLELPPVPAVSPCPGQGRSGTPAAAIGPRADAEFVPADYLLPGDSARTVPAVLAAALAAGVAVPAGVAVAGVRRHRRTGGSQP